MSFLKLEDGKVVLTEEGKTLPLVKKLIQGDNTKDKWKAQDVLTGLYFIYKPETMYDNLEHETKILEVSSKMLKRDWNEYMKMKVVRELAEFYSKLVTTQSMRNLLDMQRDMEKFKEHISKIPMETIDYVDYDIEYKDDDGNLRMKRVQKRIKRINTEEKQKAYKALLDMQKLYNQMRELVKEESTKIKVAEKKRRLFEKDLEIPFNV